MNEDKEKEPYVGTAQEEFMRKFSNYENLSPEEKKDVEKQFRLLMFKSFHEEVCPLQYALWICFLGLFIDAGYKAMTGGDWITPLACFGGLLILGFVLFFIASVTPD